MFSEELVPWVAGDRCVERDGWVQGPLDGDLELECQSLFEVFWQWREGVVGVGKVFSCGCQDCFGCHSYDLLLLPSHYPRRGQAGQQLSIIPTGHDNRVMKRTRSYHFYFILAAVSSHLCKPN